MFSTMTNGKGTDHTRTRESLQCMSVVQSLSYAVVNKICLKQTQGRYYQSVLDNDQIVSEENIEM